MMRMVGIYLCSILLSIVNYGNIIHEDWQGQREEMELSHLCDSCRVICYLYPASQLHTALIKEGD